MPSVISIKDSNGYCQTVTTSMFTDSALTTAPVECQADEKFCLSFNGKGQNGPFSYTGCSKFSHDSPWLSPNSTCEDNGPFGSVNSCWWNGCNQD